MNLFSRKNETKLPEITRDEFWALEDAIRDGKHIPISGNLTVEKTAAGSIYRNESGIWLRSFNGIYFAKRPLMKLLK